jgi:hypothetical protein
VVVRNPVSSRPLRLLFAANFVSMVDSGMNSSAVYWYILQATHSEQLLGILVVAQALLSLLLMPFTGVPFSGVIGIASGLYLVGGTARGVGGVALSSSIMEAVPKRFMGRVSTLFSIVSIMLQISLAVARIAHNVGLTSAIFVIATLYLFAAFFGWLIGRSADTPASSNRAELEASASH